MKIIDYEIRKVPSSRRYPRLKNNDSFSSYQDQKTEDLINYFTKHGQQIHICSMFQDPKMNIKKMSDIMVYLAMFGTIIDQIKSNLFLCPQEMKMSHYFSVFDTLWNLGLF